tara:strand:- start:131512 stop:131946 length:435 start_codon:yes stop_codon:yes gene_type:complete
MSEINYKKLSIEEVQTQKESFIAFLYQHLDQFGDDQESIKKCFDYITDDPRGGVVYCAHHGDTLAGLTAILHTGMQGFAPENFLVYIAVDNQFRGNGIGKKIIDIAKADLKSAICLHVEPDNPAKRLYEREGFTNKYLEMRYHP